MSPRTPPISVTSLEAKQALRLRLRSRQGCTAREGLTQGLWVVVGLRGRGRPGSHGVGVGWATGAVLGSQYPIANSSGPTE